ncbi:MAG TPA: NAD(P)/FAD-dependent oxidoreductase [Dehalococcoidia bacterium]|nr:NAD(P)/FAD-dependent oxidoreductase [Dehalococcoidia bacterium]
MARTVKTKYLVIGNSAGGIGAAESIREADRKGKLILISDEPYPAYSRPLIAEHLAEGRPLEKMLYRPADFYEKNGISVMLGRKVTALDSQNHIVKLADGKTIDWQKLLLATGGSPIVPAIEGTDLNGVFTFTTLDDARAIDDFLNQYHREVRAVVIGGGLIGMSATDALVKRKVRVTVVELKDRILNTILDEEASALEAAALEQAGVDIITGQTVQRIDSSLTSEIGGVTLEDGRSIGCEMVVLAIGVRPRLELVNGGGMKTNRGIVVDRHMATSETDIYACGDVAEGYDFIYGENRLTPVWPNAYIGGRVAGLNMAGTPMEYSGGTAVNALKYFGENVVSAGVVAPPDGGYEVIANKTGHIYKKVVLKDGLIIGMVLAGDIETSGIVYNLMKDRVDVSGFKEVLVDDDFGLVSLPESIWRPMLEIPADIKEASVTSVEPPEEVLVGE